MQMSLQGQIVFGALGNVPIASIDTQALVLLIIALAIPLFSAAAVRWPLVTMVLFLLVGPLAGLMQMTTVGRPLEAIALMGIQPSAAVLIAMLGAVVWRTLLSLYNRRSTFPASLRWSMTAFAAWVLFEIARNVPIYGVSAIGEFRSSYLILAMPAYVAVSFSGRHERRGLLAVVAISSTVVTVAAAPIVGMLKGWGIGAGNRFFPAILSLGILLGWLGLFLAARARALRIAMTLVWLLAIPAAALVLVDGHRSVWLVALALPVALLVLGEIDLLHTPGWIVPVVAMAGLAVLLITAVGFNPVSFVTTRAVAFTAPAQDPTTRWREAQWRAQLIVWREQPVLGRGLGGYWEEGRRYGGAGTVPHNLYVQILTKLGVIGLALWLLTAACVALFLIRGLMRLRHERRRDDLDYVLVVMGLVGLVAVHVYGVAYGLEYYGLLFTGLGVAATAYSRDATRAVPRRPSEGDPIPSHRSGPGDVEGALRPSDPAHLEWLTGRQPNRTRRPRKTPPRDQGAPPGQTPGRAAGLQRPSWRAGLALAPVSSEPVRAPVAWPARR